VSSRKRPRVALLTIGSELTSGTRVDTNSGWLAKRMPALGLEGWLRRSAPDELGAIETAYREAAASCDVIVSTGGLGPTSDDITRDALARLLGVPLVLDEACLERLTARFARFGRTPSPSNRRQCEFPRGARVLVNEIGTADGFQLEVLGRPTYVLPGVPREMRWLFEKWLEADLRARGGVPRAERVWRIVGLPESTLGDRLAAIEAEPGVEMRYCVEEAHGTIECRLLLAGAEGEERPATEARADALAARAHDLAGRQHVCATGERGLAEALVELLIGRKLRVATAESCTGGRIAAALTGVAGSSATFLAGTVAYANEAKTRHLGVPEDLLAAHGAVSAEVARSMAEGALARSEADLAVSTTGVAGPGGGSPEKPVGLVHMAVARRGGETTHVERRYVGEREQIQIRAAAGALDLLRLAAQEATAPQ
jgi:nicotinamide-nucleotide amidase